MMERYIEVILPEHAENMELHYEKVAERDAFREEDAQVLLQRNTDYENSIKVGSEDSVKLVDLEDGIYQIFVSGDEAYEFAPMLVSMPAWTIENEEQLLYEVSIEPKYTKLDKPEPEQTTFVEMPIVLPPQTGDSGNGMVFGMVGVISFIIVVIMSCHNRFKCARMSE